MYILLTSLRNVKICRTLWPVKTDKICTMPLPARKQWRWSAKDHLLRFRYNIASKIMYQASSRLQLRSLVCVRPGRKTNFLMMID